MKNLWVFTRDYDTLKPSNSVPFPSYICVAFSNSEMARRIWEERDLAVRTIGRCVEALVVDQLAADVESSKRFVGKDVELACLLAVLGTENDYMEQLPTHLSAIKFTKMVFLALDNFYSFTHETVPSDIPHVVQQTFGILSLALPHQLNTINPPTQTGTLKNISNGQSKTYSNPVSIV
jgi:hypothetical protein